jgi:hypothetical protein
MRRLIPAVVLAFACGFAVCWLYCDARATHGAAPPQFDFTAPITVVQMTVRGGEPHRYVPYSAVIDNERASISEPPEQGREWWIIRLSNSRIVIFAIRADE